jgi:SNF2 family DNA or RNA helicase
MKMNISEKIIREHCSSIIYERGEEYYKSGKVSDIKVQREYHKSGSFFVYDIEASVEASYFDEYFVEIMLSDRSGFMTVNCDCPFFSDNHRKLGFCKHIVAVMLKFVKEHYEQAEAIYGKSKLDRLLKDIKYNTLKLSDIKKNLKLELNYNYNLYENINSSLELKVGLDKAYVVKNMKQFLQAVERVQELEFGKGFTFKPLEQQFSTEDKKLIEFLLEISEIDHMLTDGEGSSGSLITGKRVYFIERQLSRFFSFLKDRQINATIQEEKYENVKVLYEDMPLGFEMSRVNDEIILKHGDEVPRPLSGKGKFFFYKGNIYVPSNEQLRMYVPLYNVFMSERSRKIQFDISEGHRVASYLVPGLKNISESLKLDSSIEESFYEMPLIAKIFLDKDSEGIVADIKFCYGDIEIDALKEESVEGVQGILLRDISKEELVVSGIESFGFRRNKVNFKMEKDEELIRFLEEGLDKLKDFSEVYYSQAFKNIKVYNSSHVKGGIRVNSGELLEFNFEMEDINPKELRGILLAARQKKKYYKLKEGGFVNLQDEQLNKIIGMMDFLNINEKELLNSGRTVVSKFNAFYLDDAFSNELSSFKKDYSFKKLIEDIGEERDIDFTLPEHLDKIMRKYQKEGFKWLKTLGHFGFGGILADEMGLGKTLQTIAFIASDKSELPSLIIAPTTLIYNWQSEVEKFAPELRTIVITGNPEDREELRKSINQYDMVITSYPLIRRDIESYKDMKFKYCILDEAQQIKNPSAQSTNAVKAIKAEGYFALTGTPLENSLTELWSIFDFIMPGYLFNHHRFLERYEIPIVRGEDEEILTAFNKHIHPFILRRLKKEVVSELPPKIEHKLVVEMTEEQRKLYTAYLLKAQETVETEFLNVGYNKNKFQIIALLTRLRQICCDPSVFIENYTGDSGKMQALEELLDEVLEQKHRVLIFSQFTSVLKNIGLRLKSKAIDYTYLDGGTPAVERNNLVKSFNAGSTDVFLISLKAGGTGLNLTGADLVIHFDPWWNPAVEQQATDRAHRIGQKKTVEVIKLIAKDSIEEKIYNLQEKKKEIFDKVVDGSSGELSLMSKLTEAEIKELFNI